MLAVLYAITQTVELSVGMYVIYKVYPDWRWKSGIAKVVFVIAYIVLAFSYIGNGLDSYISNIFVFLLSVEIGILYCLFFKGRFWSICLWELMYSINLAIIKLPLLIVYGMIEQKKLGEVNRGGINFGMVVWCAVIDIFLAVLVMNIGKFLRWIKSLLLYKKSLLLVVIIIEWSLLTYNMWLGQQGFKTVDLVINIILIICSTLIIQYFVLYMAYQNNKAEKQRLDMAQSLIQSHYHTMKELHNRSNHSLHDVKHHMLSIAGCLESREIDKARDIVDTYLEELKGNSYQVWTGFSFLDFFINHKNREMRENQIAFSLEVELYEYPLEDGEMGIVLGNLLDNAIEAAKKCEVTKRKIDMRLQTRNDMFVLSIKNSIVEMPKLKQGRFITSKENKNAHGLGVENVKRIVEKYGGSIDFQYDNEQFEVTILI